MKNKYEDIKEAVLKSAFKEAAEQDLAELEAMDIEILYPTEKQRRDIERAAKKAERKASPRFGRVWRAVAMITIVCCLGCGLLMAQPSVRASVWDVVTSFFEKYFTFGYDNDAANKTYNIGEYTITYIPAGYEIIDRQEQPIKTILNFNNGHQDLLVFLYTTPFNQISGDNENTTVKGVMIGEQKGCFVKESNTDVYKLIWGNDNHTFTIKAAMAEKEIIKIAENIK